MNVRKKCEICDRTYSLFGYQSHMQAMHESGKSETLLKCDQCDYTSLGDIQKLRWQIFFLRLTDVDI